MKRILAAALCATAIAPAAQAIEVTGGMIELSYSAFLDDMDADKASVKGSVEFAFDHVFSAQLDIGADNFGLSQVDNLSLGAHGIYHLNQSTSVGAFYTRDSLELAGFTDHANYFGVEAGHGAGPADFEGYLGRIEADGADGTTIGVSGRYAMPNTLGVTGAIDYADIEGLDVRTLSVRIDGDLSENVNLFVEAGTTKLSTAGGSDSEPFVGIGGRITFGAARGTTFERRSVAELLPGF